MPSSEGILMLDYRSWLGVGDDEEQDPVKKTLDYLGSWAPQSSAQPAPEDYSTATISPPAPVQPTSTAPFQDTYAPQAPVAAPESPQSPWSVSGALETARNALASLTAAPTAPSPFA